MTTTQKVILRGAMRNAAIVTGILFALGCGTAERPVAGRTGRNDAARGVVLVTVEQFRADLLRAYGGDLPLPNLELFAQEGVLFEDAASVVPLARPAVASALTGLPPGRTGVRDETIDRLPEGLSTLAGRFSAAGFDTAAFVNSPLLSFSSGLQTGFALFDGPEDLLVGPGRGWVETKPAEATAENFRSYLQALPGDRQFFAWIHLGDARGSMMQPQGGSKGPYRDALVRVDVALGVIRDAVRSRRDAESIEVVIVGSHGTMLGEDGAWGDAYWLRKETLQIPLLWSGGRAGGRGGERDATPVSLLDVSAGVLAAMGVEGFGEGHDPFATTPNDGERVRRAWTWATDDDFAWPTLSAVHEGGTWRLSNPSNRGHISAVPRDRRASAQAIELLAKVGVRPAADAARATVVPANPNVVIEQFLMIRKRLALERPKIAWRLANELMTRIPENVATWSHALFLASMTGEPDTIRRVTADALRRFPDRPEVLHWAAHCFFALDEVEDAEALVHAAVLMGAGDADLYYDLACARSRAGDVAGSLEWLGKSVEAGFRNWEWMERDPDLVNARSGQGYAALLKFHGR